MTRYTPLSLVLEMLSRTPLEFSEAVAGSDVPADRLSAWLSRKVVDVSDAGGRGSGNRRKFHLLDVAALRLTAMLTDDHRGLSLGLPAAREIVQKALYMPEGFVDMNGRSKVDAARYIAGTTLDARWLVARRVRYADPERNFWDAALVNAPTAADAIKDEMIGFKHLPAQVVLLEVGPALKDMVRAILLSRGLDAAFPDLFKESPDA